MRFWRIFRFISLIFQGNFCKIFLRWIFKVCFQKVNPYDAASVSRQYFNISDLARACLSSTTASNADSALFITSDIADPTSLVAWLPMPFFCSDVGTKAFRKDASEVHFVIFPRKKPLVSILGHHLKQHPKSLRAILQTSQFLLTSRSSQPHQIQFWLRILLLNSFRTETLTPNQIVLVKWRMDMDQCSISPLLSDLVPGFWRGDSLRHLMKAFDRSPHLFRPPLSRLALRELSVIMYYFICSAIVITILFDYFERQRGNYYQISNYQSAFY